MTEYITNFLTNWRFEIGIFGVLLFSFIAGYLVKWALDCMTRRYKVPVDCNEDKWATIVAGTNGFADRGDVAGRIIGTLERLLYVVAIWQGALVIIPGWMALKVATKWQSWSKLLDDIDIHPQLADLKLHAIRYLSWRLSQRFLLGNLLNIFVAGIICYAATAFIALMSP